MSRQRSLSLYLQLVPRRQWSSAGDMRLVSTTAEPPTTRERGSVVVKIKVVVPDEAFQPSRYPTAEVNVPLAMLAPAADTFTVEAEQVES